MACKVARERTLTGSLARWLLTSFWIVASQSRSTCALSVKTGSASPCAECPFVRLNTGHRQRRMACLKVPEGEQRIKRHVWATSSSAVPVVLCVDLWLSFGPKRRRFPVTDATRSFQYTSWSVPNAYDEFFGPKAIRAMQNCCSTRPIFKLKLSSTSLVPPYFHACYLIG